MNQTFRRPMARPQVQFGGPQQFGKSAQSPAQSAFDKHQLRLQKAARERLALKRAGVKAEPDVKATLEQRGEMLERQVGRLQQKVADQKVADHNA